MKVNLHIFRQYVNNLKAKEPEDVFSEYDLVNTIMFLQKKEIMVSNGQTDPDLPSEVLIGEDGQKLDEYFNQTRYLGLISIFAQILSAWIILKNLYEDRLLAILCWEDFFARMVFAVIIQVCIGKDYGPIAFSNSLINLRIVGSGVTKKVALIKRFLRSIFNSVLLFVIPFYIITIDSAGEENGVDLVQNFTALYILCDID